MSGFSVPKLMPTLPMPSMHKPPWAKRPSIEQRYALRTLMTQVFADNPIEKPPRGYGGIADRQSILDFIDAGQWGTARAKLELGQANLPPEETQKIVNAMTLLE